MGFPTLHFSTPLCFLPSMEANTGLAKPSLGFPLCTPACHGAESRSRRIMSGAVVFACWHCCHFVEGMISYTTYTFKILNMGTGTSELNHGQGAGMLSERGYCTKRAGRGPPLPQ